MNRLPTTRLIAIMALITGSNLLPVPPACAQEEANGVLEEVIVIGMRRQGRTATTTPVPVDLFQRKILKV